MLRSLLAGMLLLVGLTVASAQTAPHRATKKRVPYSTRKAKQPAGPAINPHTGRPYGAALQQHPELRDQVYLAPGVPMRKKSTYQPHSSYSSRPTRPATGATAGGNTTLGGGAKAVPTTSSAKRP